MRVVSFVAAALGSATAATEEGWELLVSDVESATGRTCFPTPGLPEWVRGTYVASGPAKWSIGDRKLLAVFDGLGLLNRFELGEGQVCYTSEWLDTSYANESEAQGYPVGMIFEDTVPGRPSCSILHPMCEMTSGGDNNWVNAIQVGDETLLLTDSPLMLRLDLATMEQRGVKPWLDDKETSTGAMAPSWVTTGRMATVGSAHPMQVPGTQTFVDVVGELGMLPGEKSLLSVYSFDGASSEPQERPKIASVRLDHAPYVHSYGVTPNYVVLPIDLEMSVLTMDFLNPKLLGSLGPRWQGIHLVDMNDGSIQDFDTDPFTHVHIINSFENETGVTIDVGAYVEGSPFEKSGAMDIPMFLNKSERDSNPLRAVPRRVHLHLSGPLAGSATYEDFSKIDGSHTDFYKLNPAHYGKPYCYYYGTQWWHDGTNYASMAVLKHDMCSDTVTYWSSPSTYVGEPFFIPAPAGEEDEGALVFVALNGSTGRSTLKVLDAKTMSEVDGTRFDLDGHIPFTAHGNFFPSTSAPSVTLV